MTDNIQCPNCKSYNVAVRSKTYTVSLGVLLLVLAGLLYYMGALSSDNVIVFTLIIGVAMFVVSLVVLYKGITQKGTMLYCKSCKYKFPLDEQ